MIRTALLALVALTACNKHVGNAICPDSPNKACVTREVCSMDAARGCQMCICEPATQTSPLNPDLGRR